MATFGVPLIRHEQQIVAMREAGFVNIHHETVLVPLNDFSGKKARTLTLFMQAILPELFSIFANRAFPAAGISDSETSSLMSAAVDSLRDTSVVVAFYMLIARGQKPLTAT